MLTDPLHPALVHVPLGLALAMPAVAAGLAIAIWRGLLPRRAWAAAVALQILLLAGGGAAFLAGDRDEKRVYGFVSRARVHAHEERAEVFLGAAGAVLAVSIGVLVAPLRRAPALAALAAAGSVAVAALGMWTGKAGGELVYRHGAAGAFTVESNDSQELRVAGEPRRSSP